MKYSFFRGPYYAMDGRKCYMNARGALLIYTAAFAAGVLLKRIVRLGVLDGILGFLLGYVCMVELIFLLIYLLRNTRFISWMYPHVR